MTRTTKPCQSPIVSEALDAKRRAEPCGEVSLKLSRPSAVFLRATVATLNERKRWPDGNPESLQAAAWLEEIETAARIALSDPTEICIPHT